MCVTWIRNSVVVESGQLQKSRASNQRFVSLAVTLMSWLRIKSWRRLRLIPARVV